MMQLPTNNQGPVKGLFLYMREIIRFHDAGMPRFVQMIFLLILVVLFGGYVLSMPQAEEVSVISQQLVTRMQEVDPERTSQGAESLMTPDVSARLISAMAGFIFLMLGAKVIATALALLYAFAWHVRRLAPDVAVGTVIRGFASKIPRLAMVSLVFHVVILAMGVTAAVLLTVIGLIIPPLAVLLASALPMLYLVATSLFAFRDLSVLSAGTKVMETFRVAWKLTNGCRRMIVGNMVLLYVLGLAVSWIAVGISSHALVATFIAAFLETIVLLITQRLVVRMYEDARGMKPIPAVPSKPSNPPDTGGMNP